MKGYIIHSGYLMQITPENLIDDTHKKTNWNGKTIMTKAKSGYFFMSRLNNGAFILKFFPIRYSSHQINIHVFLFLNVRPQNAKGKERRIMKV